MAASNYRLGTIITYIYASQTSVHLQVCIELVRHEQSLPTLPVLVLTDCFDMLTIIQCEKLFCFVESNVSVWKEDTFFTPCKTSVLRMCNGELSICQLYVRKNYSIQIQII